MRQKFFSFIGKTASQKPGRLLIYVGITTLILGVMASKLTMTTSFSNLLPGKDPIVKEYNYVFEEFNGANTLFVAVEGEKDKMIAFAEHILPSVENLDHWIMENGSEPLKNRYRKLVKDIEKGKLKHTGNLVSRVDLKIDQSFIRDHGLMLMKESDLENNYEVFLNPNLPEFLTHLNNSLEKEYIQSEEKLSTTQQENSAIEMLDGLESWTDNLTSALLADHPHQQGKAAAEAITLGTPYLISPDRSMMIVRVEPSFQMMDTDFLLVTCDAIKEIIRTNSNNFNVTAGLAGGSAMQAEETVAQMKDSSRLTYLALGAVFIILAVSFRMLISPFLAFVGLIVGIIWTMGLSWLLVGELNMMTSMVAVILVGLGIDFSVHIISVFTELTNKGYAAKQAIEETLAKVGIGIMTGAVTTAVAFLTLIVARSDGMRELGIVAGTGILMTMLSTLFVLPPLLVLREKYFAGSRKRNIRDLSYEKLGKTASFIARKRISFGMTFIVITGIMLFFMFQVKMDYNMLNMEPVNLPAIVMGDKIIEKFNLSSEATMITTGSLDENERITKLLKGKSTISMVESITDFIPVKRDQLNRAGRIQKINTILSQTSVRRNIQENDYKMIQDELERLEMNIIEMQDMAFIGGQDKIDEKAMRLVGHPGKEDMKGKLSNLIENLSTQKEIPEQMNDFAYHFGITFKDIALDMADTSMITLDMLPEMIREKHISKDGSRYLITIYPKGNVWDMQYLESFTKELRSITPRFAGTPPIFYTLIKVFGEDGRRATLMTLIAVLLLLWFDFRSIRNTLIAIMPLLIGMLWMLGLMGLTGIRLSIMNVAAVPLIIGIGIDYGVHILHRYQIEKNNRIYSVYSSTGRSIVITSMTTLIGFGSMLFASFRGFGHLGQVLSLGICTCMIASLLIMPILLKKE